MAPDLQPLTLRRGSVTAGVAALAAFAVLAVLAGCGGPPPPPASGAVTMARDYELGPDGKLVMDRLPRRAAATVAAVEEDDPDKIVFVGDSASGGTALATGVRTSIGRIGTAAKTDLDLPNIVEVARGKGMRTGIITTASVTDASPASFSTHVRYRFCMGPEHMAGENFFGIQMPGCPQDESSAGGPGSIAEQLAAQRLDVLLGGGRKYFDQHVDAADPASTTPLDQALANGYTLAATGEELAAAHPGERLLGLFAPDSLETEMDGEGGRRAEFLRLTPDGDLIEPEPFPCVANPKHDGTPTLEAMVTKALELLDNERGFFLMVEGASIDKQAHNADPCGSIGELLAFDRALAVAQRYATQHPTLIIVTADHGQSQQIIPYPSFFAGLREGIIPIPSPADMPRTFRPQAQHTPGRFARLISISGSILNVNYATNVGADLPMFPAFQEHTGVEVPVLAAGPGSEPVVELLRQPQIFDIMVAAMGGR
jgi:alkaline phosphatase